MHYFLCFIWRENSYFVFWLFQEITVWVKYRIRKLSSCYLWSFLLFMVLLDSYWTVNARLTFVSNGWFLVNDMQSLKKITLPQCSPSLKNYQIACLLKKCTQIFAIFGFWDMVDFVLNIFGISWVFWSK